MENIFEENLFTSSKPYCSLMRENEGTNAAKNEPSINTLRRRFVSLNAAKKTSAKKPLPTSVAIRISRTKPLIRETIVKNDTRNAERRILIKTQCKIPSCIAKMILSSHCFLGSMLVAL